MNMQGRAGIVTGAGRGIGRAVALLLAKEGASVIVNDPGFGRGGEETEEKPADAVVAEIGLTRADVMDRPFYYGKGCVECNETGYKGRKGLFELLVVSEPVRELINIRAPAGVIRAKALELGMHTLREDGIRSILDGVTTVEEVLKYT